MALMYVLLFGIAIVLGYNYHSKFYQTIIKWPSKCKSVKSGFPNTLLHFPLPSYPIVQEFDYNVYWNCYLQGAIGDQGETGPDGPPGAPVSLSEISHRDTSNLPVSYCSPRVTSKAVKL